VTRTLVSGHFGANALEFRFELGRLAAPELVGYAPAKAVVARSIQLGSEQQLVLL
jgi:hypothetical protein